MQARNRPPSKPSQHVTDSFWGFEALFGGINCCEGPPHGERRITIPSSKSESEGLLIQSSPPPPLSCPGRCCVGGNQDDEKRLGESEHLLKHCTHPLPLRACDAAKMPPSRGSVRPGSVPKLSMNHSTLNISVPPAKPVRRNSLTLSVGSSPSSPIITASSTPTTAISPAKSPMISSTTSPEISWTKSPETEHVNGNKETDAKEEMKRTEAGLKKAKSLKKEWQESMRASRSKTVENDDEKELQKAIKEERSMLKETNDAMLRFKTTDTFTSSSSKSTRHLQTGTKEFWNKLQVDWRQKSIRRPVDNKM